MKLAYVICVNDSVHEVYLDKKKAKIKGFYIENETIYAHIHEVPLIK